MTRRAAKPPVKDPPRRLRQRQRADGSWRIWWEPEATLRSAGFQPVDLDTRRLTWSVREAERLNALVDGGRGTAVETGRTIADLIHAYRKSPKWDSLAAASRASYDKNFRLIERKWGPEPVIDFTRPVIVEWHETLYREAGPSMALALVRALSLLMSYAGRKGWRADNPCLQIGASVPPPRKRVATWDELDALLGAALDLGQPSMAAAIALAVWQGQRQTDIIAANMADLKDGRWYLVRSKTGSRASLVLHPEVLPWLTGIAPPPGITRVPLLISATTGARWRADNFRAVWARVRDRAGASVPGIGDLQFRDLRRTFGHLARACGQGRVTTRDVGDALGNSAYTDPRISATYMPETSAAADHAILAIRRPEKKKATGTEET